MRFHARAAATALLIAIIGAPGVGAAAAGPGTPEAAPAPETVEPAGAPVGRWAWVVVTDPLSGASLGPGSPFGRALGGNTLVDRTGEGTWTVVWEIVPATTFPNGGTIHVTSLGSDPAACSVVSWVRTSAKVEAKVRCGNWNDPYVDSPFIAMWQMHPSPYESYEGKSSGYAFMNLPSSSGTPSLDYQATSSGDQVTSTRTGVGSYLVTMPGLERAEHALVTSWKTDTVCRPDDWSATASEFVVEVGCRLRDNTPSDEGFTIFAGRNVSMGGVSNGRSAYAVVRKSSVTRYRVAAADGFNPAGGPIVVRYLAKGHVTVRFVGMPAGGAAVVSSIGSTSTCQVGSLPRTGKDLQIGIRCFAPSDVPNRGRFVVSWGK